MSELQRAKRFIIKYSFMEEDYTDESCDNSITLPLINCAKMVAAYSESKERNIERIQKQRNDYEQEIFRLQKKLLEAQSIQKSEMPTREYKERRWKCMLCGGDKFTSKTPHKCVGGFRKHKIVWKEITDETKDLINSAIKGKDLRNDEKRKNIEDLFTTQAEKLKLMAKHPRKKSKVIKEIIIRKEFDFINKQSLLEALEEVEIDDEIINIARRTRDVNGSGNFDVDRVGDKYYYDVLVIESEVEESKEDYFYRIKEEECKKITEKEEEEFSLYLKLQEKFKDRL